MQAGYKFLVRMLCGLCLVGGFAACQKVDLPSEEGEDTEQSGQTGDKPGNEGHEPGGADEAEDEVPLPPEYEGAWTVARILSEYEGVDLDTDYEEMVVGYIVGACDRTMKNALFTIDEIRAAGVNSNVLIADSKDERDASRCMPIELKKGTDVREEANLVDNPEVLGRRIGLLGLVKTYFKVVGLKNVAYHEWLTNGGDVEEPEPEPEEPEEPEGPEESEKPEKPEEPEEPEPTPDPDPEPGPIQKDTIIIDSQPGHIEGGRSIGHK